METLATLSVERFLDELASGNATPGGGSAAAIMGAMGAALVSMVANLTIGKKGYEAAEGEMRTLLTESEALRTELAGMVAEDIAAFDSLMAAYRMPKGEGTSDDAKAARSAAIQRGLMAATEAPLACARGCAAAVRLAERAVERGNVNVISDVGVGVVAAWAALRSAALNVHINAPQIKDRAFTDRAISELDTLLAECGPLADRVHERVKQRMR
jgi:formiminotetrahydrofolate cyclodeaminase